MEQVSARTGLDTAHLARIENGQLNPTLATLLRLALGLEMAVIDLFRAETKLP